MKRINGFTFIAMLAFILAVGCQQTEQAAMESEAEQSTEMQSSEMQTMESNQMMEITNAIAVLHPTEGNEAHGTVTFEQGENGIVVCGIIEGLTPGKHGFHIHEFGDCSAADAATAGGHYNPEGVEHGARTDEVRHVGDLGNIEANDEGMATFEFTDAHLALNGSHSILGRAVVVHGGEDDLTSQPSGAAGPRVACGVVGLTQ